MKIRNVKVGDLLYVFNYNKDDLMELKTTAKVVDINTASIYVQWQEDKDKRKVRIPKKGEFPYHDVLSTDKGLMLFLGVIPDVYTPDKEYATKKNTYDKEVQQLSNKYHKYSSELTDLFRDFNLAGKKEILIKLKELVSNASK